MDQTDREALLVLYRSTNGPGWKKKRGWDTRGNLSKWHGVEVNDQGRVVKLSLDSNNLQGTIPEELGKLGALTQLVLWGNNLSGHIPRQLGDLGALKTLDLSINRLEGPIPKEVGALSRLTELLLFNNQLTGHIPQQLGNLSALESLDLSWNKLDGHIPTELGTLSKLETLYLWNNKLTGPIPSELGHLSALKDLHLYKNQLSGPIPPELGKLAALKELYLGWNQLSEIPPEVLELCGRNTIEVSWDDNAWSRPPLTVLESGIESALGWWKDVKLFGEGKSNRLKMVLVGLAEAGKTTVVRHFTGGSIPNLPDRTVGIEITDWRPLDEGPLRVSVWDFAGQADYYASHQLFLTKGALFLLVVDLHAFSKEVQRAVDDFTDPRGRIYWWLEMLYMRVPGAAIALVGSHVDDMEKEGLDADSAGKHLHEGEASWFFRGLQQLSLACAYCDRLRKAEAVLLVPAKDAWVDTEQAVDPTCKSFSILTRESSTHVVGRKPAPLVR